MREICANTITNTVKEMCIKANRILPDDLCKVINECGKRESFPLAKSIFDDMTANITAAEGMNIPVCQDCGMAVIFAEVGQDVKIVDGDFEEAVNKGVALGYTEGYLRCSVVSDPLRRVNTGNNTPAILHTRIVPGDKIHLTVAPKGFGSENMSVIKMFTPSVSREDIINFITESVVKAGSNPIIPVVLGIGIGGDFEYCALLAKKALCRSVSKRNNDEFYAKMEQDILEAVNKTGIGAQGFGGDITALAVNIEAYPTHIASLPVAVNVGCHVTRHTEKFI